MSWFKWVEHKTEPLAPHRVFFARVWRNFLLTLGIVAFSLVMGTTGYHYFADLDWLDGLMNAAMILTGMGPCDKPQTAGGKLFATSRVAVDGGRFAIEAEKNSIYSIVVTVDALK